MRRVVRLFALAVSVLVAGCSSQTLGSMQQPRLQIERPAGGDFLGLIYAPEPSPIGLSASPPPGQRPWAVDYHASSDRYLVTAGSANHDGIATLLYNDNDGTPLHIPQLSCTRFDDSGSLIGLAGDPLLATAAVSVERSERTMLLELEGLSVGCPIEPAGEGLLITEFSTGTAEGARLWHWTSANGMQSVFAAPDCIEFGPDYNEATGQVVFVRGCGSDFEIRVADSLDGTSKPIDLPQWS